MTDSSEPSISADELDWKNAEVQEGRQPGVVVSVRLGPAEAARVRVLAESAGLTVSQVIRRALAEYEAQNTAREPKVFVAAFTYGGTMPLAYEQVWHSTGPAQTQLPGEDEAHVGTGGVPTTTEPTRVSERVTVAS